MDAICSDKGLGNLYPLYVDQWDRERVVSESERKIDFFKKTIRRIYITMIRTECSAYEMLPQIRSTLPQQTRFVHSKDLL